MGMAASQARYLALVARKSNCEYEGQQINQARSVLANQSANLFNQMLGLNVPIPPSTQDFTKTQYSYTDGVNASVIDSWKQLANDPEYNYVVTSHYFTDRYTGSMKKMSDPQVQLSNSDGPIAPLGTIEAFYKAMANAKTEMDTKYNNWQDVKKTQEAQISKIKSEAQKKLKYTGVSDEIIEVDTEVENVKYRFKVSDAEYYDVIESKDPTVGAAADANGKEVLDRLYDLADLGVLSLDQINAKLLAQDPSFELISDISDLKYDTALTSKQEGLLNTFGLTKKRNATAYTGDNYIQVLKEAEDIANLPPSEDVKGSISGYPIYKHTSASPLTEGYLDDIEDCQKIIDEAGDAYNDSKTVYDGAKAAYDALTKPIYVGNSPLTYLDELTDDQSTELHQIVSDMIANGVDTDIINRFDANGDYLGGVYSFKLNGVTYYTTYDNLCDAYASNQWSNNDIDAQYKMPYYNASYISTRIDQEQKALLETDGNGRFSTVRFENDSVTYSLNVETITDDAAYQDAMNQYNYENAKYDKMVQDINAKTSIIQQEDRQLELRLKQLDTEQRALKTEMEAVQGVVKDNVEDTFKTFSN